MNIVFSEDDLDATVTENELAGFVVTDEDSADKFVMDNTPNTLVSYVAAPSNPVNGSFCYKMLVNGETYELYFYRKHRINAKNGPGFMPYDIRHINISRTGLK